MSLINKIIKWIYQIDLSNETTHNDFIPLNIKSPELTRYNPATGLPMVGCLDISGNLIGTSNQNDYSHHINSMNDYYRYYSR